MCAACVSVDGWVGGCARAANHDVDIDRDVEIDVDRDVHIDGNLDVDGDGDGDCLILMCTIKYHFAEAFSDTWPVTVGFPHLTGGRRRFSVPTDIAEVYYDRVIKSGANLTTTNKPKQEEEKKNRKKIIARSGVF